MIDFDLKLALAAAAVAFAVTAPVNATTLAITPDGQWHSFDVDNLASASGGLEWIDAQSAPGYNNDFSALAFSFTVNGSAHLKIVDGGFAGDVFRIFDNGTLVGETSGATNTFPSSTGTDFDAAFADGNFSRGDFFFGSGSHQITGLLIQSAFDDVGVDINATVGAVQLNVPEPASLAVLITGLGLLGVARRRAD